MSRLGNLTGRLYRGEVSIDFVGRQKLWYTISGIILLVSILALIFRGLDYSVEFKGGSQWTVPATAQVTQTKLEQIVTNGGGVDASANRVKPFQGKVVDGTTAFWQVQSGQLLNPKAVAIATQIAKDFKMPVNDVAVTTVGSSWGSQVSHKAIEALIAFLIVIVLYLSIAFDWRMAASAFVALAHDIVITIGVYALTGFQVSPATIIGLLTILGYSLYDTVVVFDKVRENTAPLLGTRKTTYSKAANLALNQTLVRSINTSLTALLPVAAILVVGTLLLGNGELKDLALVLFVGMLSGTYSSICIATPVLADLKERQPEYKQLTKQVALREAGGRGALRRAAKSGAAVGAASSGASAVGAANGGATNVGAANGGAANSGATAVGLSASGRRPGAADPGRGDAELTDVADEDLEPDDAVTGDEAVAAAQPAGAGQARAASARPPGARQQPVRRPAAKRRPSGKKKRR
ncbi:MAG TPA: protein translocase subunit SecF [Streptosporangiaceae bacterium]|jgi:preprotein translocase subunit SecF|nr:protein translocase subunit SecF [Streptosporangiaceae bacterium]